MTIVVAPMGVPTTVVFELWWHPASTAATNPAQATTPHARRARRRRGSIPANTTANPVTKHASAQIPAAMAAKIHHRVDDDAANTPTSVGVVRGAFGEKISIAFAFPGHAPAVGGSAVAVIEEVTNITENAAGVPGVTATGHGVKAHVVSAGSSTGQPNDTCSPCAPNVPSETTWPLKVAVLPGITVISPACPGAN